MIKILVKLGLVSVRIQALAELLVEQPLEWQRNEFGDVTLLMLGNVLIEYCFMEDKLTILNRSGASTKQATWIEKQIIKWAINKHGRLVRQLGMEMANLDNA